MATLMDPNFVTAPEILEKTNEAMSAMRDEILNPARAASLPAIDPGPEPTPQLPDVPEPVPAPGPPPEPDPEPYPGPPPPSRPLT
jgi:hypothetical protein